MNTVCIPVVINVAVVVDVAIVVDVVAIVDVVAAALSLSPSSSSCYSRRPSRPRRTRRRCC